MKIATYSLIIILVFLSIFTIGYLVNNRYISFWGGNLRTALVSRFIEPQEVKSLYDLLDKLPSQGSGPMTISSDGQSLIYYDPETGYLHRVILGYDQIELNNSQPHDEKLQKLHPYLLNLQWSQAKNKILASDGMADIFYNLISGKSKVLPQNIRSATLSPLGDKLAYIENDPESNSSWISISDSDTGSSKKLLSIASGNWVISWIDENMLSLAYNNSGQWSLMELNTDNSQLTRILSNLSNLEARWSPNGRSLLYSYLDNTKLILTYKNVGGSSSESKLPIETSASNCIWNTNNSSIFCSVRKTSPQESENDEFVSLRLGENPQNLRINNSSKIKAENLLLSADEKYLFFRNTHNGNFYRLRIQVQ